MKYMLQDWREKGLGLRREKALLQKAKAQLERDKAQSQFDQAEFWGMLMEECGPKPTATKPMAPLLLMLGEACLILQKNQSLGKPERVQFLQKLLDETEGALLEVLDGWNRVAVKQKEFRSLVARIRNDDVDGVAAADGAADGK